MHRHLRTLPLLGILLLAIAGPAAPQALKLNVPPGMYGPDLDAQPQAPRKKDELPPKPKQHENDKDADARELDGVTVKGKRSPASKLPTLGTDKPRDRDIVDKLTDWYKGLETDPDKLSPEQKAFLQHATQNNDPNHHAAAGGTPTREATDYQDPIEATKAKKKP
jgi:hypothetical protein